MSSDQPVVAGVVLPRPSTHTRTPVEVSSSVTLADGSTATYHLGYRLLVAMRWDLATEQVAATVERLGMLVGPVEYVDLDGTSYVVTVTDREPREAIRGTDPIRYTVGLTLQEHTPRLTPAPDPTPVVVPPAPGGDDGESTPVAEVASWDPNILLVHAVAVPDPNDPGVLVWSV